MRRANPALSLTDRSRFIAVFSNCESCSLNFFSFLPRICTDKRVHVQRRPHSVANYGAIVRRFCCVVRFSRCSRQARSDCNVAAVKDQFGHMPSPRVVEDLSACLFSCESRASSQGNVKRGGYMV